LQALKHAQPFLDTSSLRKDETYKKLVKEPCDLKLMLTRLSKGEYKALKDVAADLISIFSNCRLYFPENTPETKCAAKLEADVVKRVKAFRQKIAKSFNLDTKGL
jgi:hypothetical protein